MKAKKATTHILASLDDIAWLFNIRGRDVKSNPVVLIICSYKYLIGLFIC